MRLDHKVIYMLGYASGLAAAHPGTGDGPKVLQRSPFLAALKTEGIQINWEKLIGLSSKGSVLQTVQKQCELLAHAVFNLVQDKKFFIVAGGDHSSAIGTWSGVYQAICPQGELGLIWIDAHMDSHTPYTSLTGNIHGMPLACLLGLGEPMLTELSVPSPKLKPKNLCLIGVRSFEKAEAELLKQLNVRVFLMEEVKQRGIDEIMQEAIRIVNQGTAGFGVSIDIDSIDPLEAPGTGVAEPNGLSVQELCQALSLLPHEEHFIGAEIAEFDPYCDKLQLTEKVIVQLIKAISIGNNHA